MSTIPPTAGSAITQKVPSIEGLGTVNPVIQKGTILVYRVFDIAAEINLSSIEKILRQESGRLRLSISRGGANAVIIRNAPVRITLGKRPLRIQDQTLQVEAVATLWDYGVLSIVLQIPIESGTAWNDLISRGALLSGDIPGSVEEINQTARTLAREVQELIRPAMQKPGEWAVFEDYIIYFLEDLKGIQSPSELLQRGSVPELILGEFKDRLSPKSRQSILENAFQYSDSDLAVMDWNSAIVIEPTGAREVVDVIEFALTHLLELRYYDDLLDHRLGALYDLIEEGQSGIWKSNYARVSQEANSRFIEFSEFIERIDNSLKVVGDFYLAVIFRNAVRRFRVPDWQESITRKMNILARVSELLLGEVNVRRAHLLEFIIILLITFEIVSALLRH